MTTHFTPVRQAWRLAGVMRPGYDKRRIGAYGPAWRHARRLYKEVISIA
jgi:hypothetical protein